jgi:trk system potassium uptake protein
MRTIIVGAGDVGFDVARLLSLQRHDVTVVDVDMERIEHVRNELDVLTVCGSGTSGSVLTRAGIGKADLMVAVTDVDEVNLLAAMIAARAGARTTIARVRSLDLAGPDAIVDHQTLGIDHIINPEDSTAAEVVALLKRAAASDVVDLAGGRIQLLGLRIDREADVVGRRLDELAARADHLAFRVMGIVRGGRTIVPHGTDRIQKDDQLFVAVQTGQVPQVVYLFGKAAARLEHIMIVGGSRVGGRIAMRMREGLSRRAGPRIILVEPDEAEAARLAEALSSTLVIHGDPTDIDLLVREGLAEMDAFVAVTPDEESNLVTCLLAKHLGVRKTVAMLSKSAYIPISRSIGLDAAVSQKLAVSREVARFLRGKHVTSVTTVLGLDAEIVEVRPGPDAPVLGRPLRDQQLPRGILLAAVVRNGDIEVATGATRVRAGDTAIAFALPEAVGALEKLFMPVSAGAPA